ncbi:MULTISPECIES: hypothetical protein [Haloarcula]|uniref:hypothetical protein n=1 Tax=Haloarcula TaxID=2237 RepID=UPI0023EBC077|nr:hypothetical protein [Halomicroarcula sp. XH51]
MTTAESSTVADSQSATQKSGTLGGFAGTFVPGLCFESGYCFWLLAFTDTPTQFNEYTELWIITPDGERILYTDPEPAAEEVQKYHDFDRVNGATITCDLSDKRFSVEMEATDGTELELTGAARQTIGTRILNTVIGLTPDAILQSRVGTTVSTLSL